MAGRRVGRVLVGPALAAALLLVTAPPAAAHTELVRSDPPNGGMVPEGRTRLTLWFDESVNVTATPVIVRTLGGLVVASSVEVTEGGLAVVVTTEPLDRGSYVIDWQAQSMVDGHAATGQVIFGSGLRPDVVAVSGESPPPELVVARWLDLGALLLVIGGLAVGGRVLAQAGPAGAGLRRAVRRSTSLAAVAACYGGVLTAFLRTRAAGAPLNSWLDQTWLALSSTSWGRWWLLREVSLVIAAIALWRWRTREHGRCRGVATAAVVFAVVIEGFAGHAAGLPTGSRAAALMSAAHILAAGVWVGGLVLLVVTVRRPRWHGIGVPSSALWRAYSPRAAVASAVLLATGLYETGRHVPTVAALTDGLYGRGVLVKVALFGAALGLAAFNTLLVNPGLAERVPWLRGRFSVPPDAPRTFSRTVAVEAVLLATAAAVAGLVTSAPTAREVAVATRPAVLHSENLDGLMISMEAIPDGAGRRRLVLRAVPTVLPETAPVVAVEATVIAPDGSRQVVGLDSSAPDRFEARLATEETGRWSVRLSLQRQARPATVVTTSWRQSATPDQLPGALRTATGLATLLILVPLVVAVQLRRRRAPPGDPVRPHPTLERSAP